MILVLESGYLVHQVGCFGDRSIGLRKALAYSRRGNGVRLIAIPI